MLCTAGDGPAIGFGPEPMWRMLLVLGDLTRRAGDLRGARSYGLHAVRHAARVASGLGVARAHAFLGQTEDALGEARNAAEHRRLAVEQLRRVGDRRTTAELLLALATPAGLREAESLARQVGWQEGVDRSRAALAQLG
jgi:hypothetical protein